MSRGIGKTQQTILDTLAANIDPDWKTANPMFVMELAGALSLRDNQIRRAVRSLEARGLVRVEKMSGNLYVRLITASDRRAALEPMIAAGMRRRAAG